MHIVMGVCVFEHHLKEQQYHICISDKSSLSRAWICFHFVLQFFSVSVFLVNIFRLLFCPLFSLVDPHVTVTQLWDKHYEFIERFPRCQTDVACNYKHICLAVCVWKFTAVKKSPGHHLTLSWKAFCSSVNKESPVLSFFLLGGWEGDKYCSQKSESQIK